MADGRAFPTERKDTNFNFQEQGGSVAGASRDFGGKFGNNLTF